MTLKELIGNNLYRLTPSSGDPAYTYYRGQRYEGILQCLLNDDNQTVPFMIEWNHTIEGQPHYNNMIYVGSDDSSCVYDCDRMAWKVVANLD